MGPDYDQGYASAAVTPDMLIAKQAAYAGQRDVSSTYRQEKTEGPPITAIALAHVGSTNNQLTDILGRLNEVRDRLFGPQAPSPGNPLRGEAAAPISGFTEAFARSAQETHMLLSQLERVTVELSNRL